MHASRLAAVAALAALAVVVALATPSAGCFRGSLGECAVACGGALGTACPSGLSCDEAEGFCQSDPAATCTGGPDIDAGLDIDGGDDIDAGLDPDGGTDGTALYEALSAGQRTTCAVRDDQTLWCWGLGDDGQLGTGSKMRSARPVAVDGAYTDWLRVDVGLRHTCGLRGTGATGSLWCWGYNRFGAWLPGAPDEALVPTEVTVGPTSWKQVSASVEFTCGITGTDELWCWGACETGQCGQNTTMQAAPAARIGAATWSAVSAGLAHVCAIRSDKTLWCWGGPHDQDGVLGLGAGAGDRDEPTQVGTAADWVAIGAYEVHTCGIREAGGQRQLFCWGRNSGNLGDGNPSSTEFTPKRIGTATDWLSIEGGGRVTCGIRDEGGAHRRHCWGINLGASLGNGDRHDRLVPTLGGDAFAWSTLAVGEDFACGLRDDGALLCWGDDTAGQLGDGHRSIEDEPAQAGLGQGLTTGWTRVVANRFGTCGLRGDELWCWGLNTDGMLAVPTATLGESNVPRRVTGAWKAVALGLEHVCAIDGNDALKCWGTNHLGQLGLGVEDMADHPTPEDVVGPTTGTWQRVAAGRDHTCAIHNGTLYCWGYNAFEQLGQGDTTVGLDVPTMVTAMTTWTEVAAGATYVCGIAGTPGSNDVLCWGENFTGQLGRGILGDNDGTPMPVNSPDSNWVALAGVGFHMAARQADGDALLWGINGSGQIGDQTADHALSPTKPFGGATWKSVAAGSDGSCGVKSDSTLLCWGYDHYGLLADGDASEGYAFQPQTADPATDWSQVALGLEHACAIRLDGSLWCWGRNTFGQLGNGQAATLTPRRIVDP